MQVIECYAVHKWDGGERHGLSFYLSNKATADKYLSENPHDIVSPMTLFIFDSMQEVGDSDIKKVRRKVWDKLTPLERKAIGMVEPPLS